MASGVDQIFGRIPYGEAIESFHLTLLFGRNTDTIRSYVLLFYPCTMLSPGRKSENVLLFSDLSRSSVLVFEFPNIFGPQIVNKQKARH